MFFSFSTWANLPINTRIKLANHYGVIKKGSTHVMGNEIVSDGYNMKDVEGLLSTLLTEFPAEDINASIIKALDRIDGKETPIVILPKKPRGRPKKL